MTAADPHSHWRAAIVQEIPPATLPTDKSVLIGLVATELLTNAVKYAYSGQPGPILIEGAHRSGGTLERGDNAPGLRVARTFPIED